MRQELLIEQLGAQGDGVARDGPAQVFVPLTLPGERVEAERRGSRARLLTVLAPSPERREPPCPHFGTCGGCELQHASEDLYRAFKRERVVEAFADRGLAPEVADLVPCPPASRRRATFSGAHQNGEFAFGFHAAMSEEVANIEVCLIVVPAIANRLGALRALAKLAADRKRPVRVTVTASASGLDIVLTDARKADERLRRALVTQALAMDAARLVLGTETLMEARRPTIDVGGLSVALPPGAFLQAAASAEGEMARLVLGHLEGLKGVADLFSGFGTFALRLARQSAVHAVEAEAAPLAALDAARRVASGLKPVTSERRDLFRRPLLAKELERFGGLVFDPPRAGAEAQAREIAGSKLKRVAAVSCNPATLARDCRILVDGGWRIVSVTPIDQFLWSHHVEAVALLEK